MNRTLSTLLKIGGSIIGLMMVLLVALGFAVNNPSVQNRILHHATHMLADKPGHPYTRCGPCSDHPWPLLTQEGNLFLPQVQPIE